MARPTAPILMLLLAALGGLAGPRARADVLVLEDGRYVEGAVTLEGDRYLVRSRFGEVTIPAAEVREHLPAQPLDELIRDRLASLAPEDTENRARLAAWLVEVGREDEGRALAEAVLETDPENAVAHQALGHVRHRGVWCTPDEARRAEGLEKHGDRWYTPEEWQSLEASAREEALERERRLEAQRVAAEVNRAVRLMTSPDPSIRERGRDRLRTLAAEHENPRLAELIGIVDEYMEQVDALAAAYAGGSGVVLSEIRATMSRMKRPIQTFETSLGSNLGGAPVRIQLPELEVIRVRTVAPVPVIVR